MLETLFPNGYLHYLAGGLLIGLGVSIIYLRSGIIPGASTFLESTLSYFSDRERFQQYKDSRGWRMFFTAGIILGSGIYALGFQDGIWTTEVSVWRLFFGGLLIGLGTRIGKGCTSGHGVCGVGSVSKASLTNVMVFMTVAIITAAVTGGVPV